MIDVHTAFMDMMMSTKHTKITLEGFARKLTRKENADLLTSVGLRRFVLTHGGYARRPKSNYFKEFNPQMERILG